MNPGEADATTADDRLRFVSLEITSRCQLACQHCYADSGPTGWHGTLTTAEWMDAIDQCAAEGVRSVQFIGGEPTLHPDLTLLVEHVLERRMEVEVFSNLVRVSEALWEVFERPGVRLATSYYSPHAWEHDAVTGRRSHDRTLANIREALRRRISVRVGVIRTTDHLDVAGAIAEMEALGVSDVGVDHVRQIGRGVRDRSPAVAELCGRCADGRLAVLPSGEVVPCVLSRWLVVGSVRHAPLADIYTGSADVRAELTDSFARRREMAACSPEDGGCAAPVCRPHLGS